MVLEQLKDGAERQLSGYDEGVKRLIFILCLPLIDGVFATLLVTGAVETFSEVVAVALTIFSGAGALAVLYSHADTCLEARKMVYRAAPVLIAGAVLVALIAPIYEQLLYIERLRYAAGLALIVIAAQLADISFADKFSTPAVILTGLLLSLKNPGAISLSLSYVLPALVTTSVAVGALYLATYLTSRDMRMGYVRRGSSVVLLLIAVSMFGVSVPSELGLAVFAVSVFASLR